VDLWSIGIITYLLLCSRLPYDDPKSEREIARQTVNEPLPKNNNGWKSLSIDSKDLIESIYKYIYKKIILLILILIFIY
jgi:serine/threonine protein kinase